MTDIQQIKQRYHIIGNSVGLNHALSIAAQVAHTDLTVLITGESGVGKEIFSQIIHQLSPRKHNSFIAVNCGAIPEGTIDSELFGHEKGSFTGAVESRKGYFETVNGGTIFLDEVGELPLGTQARLLRVLETKEYIRVGSSKVQKTDVRVIAATNVNLLELIQRGKFREDLYYRLNTVPIKVPALRERKEDIYILFRKFCIDFADRYNTKPVALDEEAKKLLTNYAWPGNVRELKNIAEQVSVLSSNKVISAEELKQFIPESFSNDLPVLSRHSGGGEGGDYSERDIMYKVLFDMKNDLNELKKIVYGTISGNQANIASSHVVPISTEQNPSMRNIVVDQSQPHIISSSKENLIEVEQSLSLAEIEKETIIKALKKHRNRKDAARELGISERTLYRKVKDYNLE